MEAYNTSVYPVFEADQVLSQKELNLIVSHLEEQDRLIRKNLTGIGIVCGSELSFPSQNSVKISCGTAVTSLGFQINWKEDTFSHYHDFEISDQFLKPDYTKESYLDKIFKYTDDYTAIKNCVELLPAGSGADDKKPIPANFFNNKVVILLLEITLIDQKNCVTTNCDDKGKRMEFNVRPLLIPINASKELLREYDLSKTYSKLAFPRYNVPFQNAVVTGAQVLDGFRKAYSDTMVSGISTAIKELYQDHKNKVSGTDLSVLESVKSKIDETVNIYKSGVNIQYVWDWIYDITEAYNEIIDFKEMYPSVCCVDESWFPFHVVLGGNSVYGNSFRTPFIKTSDFSKKEKKKSEKFTLLFRKLAHLIASFEVVKVNDIKVTPSKYGNYPLSKKTIPYYYKSVLELNKKWNPGLTAKNQNDSILSYYSDLTGYTSKLSVQKPLLFDIEPYNFFRVEGHIGTNYKTAIQKLNLIRDSHNLPFKITAVNAVDFLNKEVDITKFEGRWDDLETDYDLARKRVYNITEFAINWMDQHKATLSSQGLIGVGSIDNFKNILIQLKNLLTNDLKEFLPNYKSFYEIFKQLNYVFLFHRWCIQLNKQTLSVLAEDLIDRLDDINELFLDDPFTVIYEEANLRWQKVYKDLFFSTFVKKHPGLEHKAGVTKGGTFVLVYVDSSIFKASAPPKQYTALLTAITAYKNNFAIEDSIKQDLIKSVKLTDYKSQLITKPDLSAIDKCKAETDNIKNSLIEVAKFNLNAYYPVEMSGFILGNLIDVLQFEPSIKPQDNSFQQTVIADFFLPYSCCGDGNTLEVKIEINEPLSISLDKLKFCQTDTNEQPIVIKGKSGGKFSGTAKDAVVQKSDKYYLQPDHASLKTAKIYTLQYELEGEFSNTVELEIVAPKDLKWEVARDKNDANTFHFSNPVQDDKHEYEIDFNDETKITTKEKLVSHKFNFDDLTKQFEVSILQLGETCPNQQKLTVKLIGDFNVSDFKSKDFFTEQ